MLELGEGERPAAIQHALAGARLLAALHTSGSPQPEWVEIHEEQLCRYGAIWILEELNQTVPEQARASLAREALALLGRLERLHTPPPAWIEVFRSEFHRRLAPTGGPRSADGHEPPDELAHVVFPAVPADPAAAEALLPEARERLRQARQDGAHEQALAWLAQLRQVLGNRTELLWHTLEAAFPVGDWALQVDCAERLLQVVGPERGAAHRHLLLTRWQALLNCAGNLPAESPDPALAALGALAACPPLADRNDPALSHPMAWLLLQTAQLAQRRGQLETARCLSLGLAVLEPEACSPSLRLEALQRAEPLAYVDGDLEEAQALRRRIHALQTSDAERVADPFRPWRLELGADRPALERWQAIRRLPSTVERLQALAESLQERPNATVLALGLLHTLRQAGAMDESACTPDPEATIPRRLWLLQRHPGTSPEQRERQRRWLDLHPGWSSSWLYPGRVAIASRQDLPRPVRLACQAVNSAEVRADLLRLGLLWQHGGLSVTWESRPQRSLEPLVGPGTGLLLATDSLGSLGLEAIAAVPRHPFVKLALEQACSRVLRGEGFSRWELSGGCLLSSCLARWLAPCLSGARGGDSLLPAGVRLLSWGDLQGWLSLGIPLPRPQEATEEAAWIEVIDERRRRDALQSLEHPG